MEFDIYLTDTALRQRDVLRNDPALVKRYKAVGKAMGYLKQNPKHPGLNTHEYTELTHKLGKKVFEAYAENNTPGAYRIFWCYGDRKGTIEVISITPHP